MTPNRKEQQDLTAGLNASPGRETMRLRFTLQPNLMQYFIFFTLFPTSLFESLDDSFEDKGRCNETVPVQMVKMQFSSRVVSNGKMSCYNTISHHIDESTVHALQSFRL